MFFQKFRYHILLHIIVFMWGFTGILGKLIHQDTLIIVWYRVLIAAFALALFILIWKKSFQIKSRKHIIPIIFVGIVVASHWLTFYYSIQLSTASLGILCLSTTTLHVSWLEPLVMKTKFSWLELLLGMIVILGIYFISGDLNAEETTAMYFGLFSALLAAIFSVFNAKLAQDLPSYQITYYELLVGFLFLSVILFFQGRFNAEIFALSLTDVLWLLFLGILCTSFAFLMTIEVVKKLGVFTVALSINLEPVYTIILAIFLLKEHEIVGPKFYLGALIIVLVVIANAFLKSKLNAVKNKAN
ncbi:MAG: DMT family transporter [Bacteroidota bacterium]